MEQKPGLGNLQRHGWDITDWHLVTDDMGRPLGKYKCDHQPLRDDIDVIRKFLVQINKRKDSKDMAVQNDATNIVYLAGRLKFDPKEYENNTTCLIDTGQQRAIQVSIFTGENAPDGNNSLASKLRKFREGDFIKTICTLRPYGVKQGDKWKNSLSIDVTAIKNDPPQRQHERSRQQADDDIPY